VPVPFPGPYSRRPSVVVVVAVVEPEREAFVHWAQKSRDMTMDTPALVEILVEVEVEVGVGIEVGVEIEVELEK
jgi:hypothetical protein